MASRGGDAAASPLANAVHLAHTAGTVTFTLDDVGAPIELVFSMGGTTWRATPDTRSAE
ncbi:MAG: hypothetical protein AAF170_18185 [Bacteroidota bacterium]